jgi:hypothetical protein
VGIYLCSATELRQNESEFGRDECRFGKYGYIRSMDTTECEYEVFFLHDCFFDYLFSLLVSYLYTV